VFADANGLGDGGQKFLTDVDSILVGAKVGQEDDELVSAHAADGVGLAHAGFQAFGDLTEDDVSGLVAQRIVYSFEVVEVDHHDGEVVLGASGALDGNFEAVAQEGAGGQAGEMVVMRDVVDVLFSTFALGEVVGYADEAGDGFVAVAKCGDDELDGDARAVLADEGPLPLVDEAALGSETKDMVVGIDLGVELGGEIDGALAQLFGVVQFDGIAAEQIALLIPKDFFCCRIDGGDDSGCVGDDDAEG
jgi:hypothetical protein